MSTYLARTRTCGCSGPTYAGPRQHTWLPDRHVGSVNRDVQLYVLATSAYWARTHTHGWLDPTYPLDPALTCLTHKWLPSRHVGPINWDLWLHVLATSACWPALVYVDGRVPPIL